MRRYLLAAVATVAIASPAAAIDNAWYAGIEVGPSLMDQTEFDYTDEFDEIDAALVVDHKGFGWDADLIGGYDFGGVRAEAEMGYKRGTVDDVNATNLFGLSGLEADGHATVLSAMGNLLLDFSDDSGWSAYVGPGLGIARVKYHVEMPTEEVGFRGSDSAIAWQLIAGVRKLITPSMELGLKYRFFNTTKLKYDGDVGINSEPFELDGKIRSHSLLASLIFNFAPPPPPPPVIVAPPPPPPATITCPDGTVILATETCPAPPPPPPPPPAGERG